MTQPKAHPEKLRRTYILSAQTLARFEAEVAPRKRGAFVAAAIENWMREQEAERIRARVLEGLQDEENEALYIESVRLWSRSDDEVWRAIDDDLWEWDDAPRSSPPVSQREKVAV